MRLQGHSKAGKRGEHEYGGMRIQVKKNGWLFLDLQMDFDLEKIEMKTGTGWYSSFDCRQYHGLVFSEYYCDCVRSG